MTLVRYEPWTFMTRLHRDLDNLLGEAPAAAQVAAAATPTTRTDRTARRCA